MLIIYKYILSDIYSWKKCVKMLHKIFNYSEFKRSEKKYDKINIYWK